MTDANEETLVQRRSRRSTAGNRMEAALAEMAALDPDPELDEDDRDFAAPADEEEIFDSDFASTDEEQEADDVGEQAIVAEEKAARRHSRRLPQKSALAKTVPKVPKGGSPKTKRRLRVSVNFAKGTNDPRSANSIGGPSTRTSLRQSTILSTKTTQSRMQAAESRRQALPKRAREAEVVYTQAELLARALDNEEENIASHRGYLAAEEEKRRRVKVVRKGAHGPVLRWISRTEEEDMPADVRPQAATKSTNTLSELGADAILTLSDSQQPSDEGTPSQPPLNSKMKVNKNYLVHELGQREGIQKPDWSKSMRAVFGDHINWDELRVYFGRHRPLARPIVRCPITGLPAPYRDPRSGVPYANLEAYKILTQILAHEFVWNEDLRCYTSSEKSSQVIGDDEEEDPSTSEGGTALASKA